MKRLNNINFVLSESNLVGNNGAMLDQDEQMKLWTFINMLSGSFYCTFISRGESNENLMKQYNCDAGTPDILAQYIFMIGEKGRICWNDKKYYDPDDVSDENFISICKMLFQIIDEGCRHMTPRSEKLNEFLHRNQQFCESLKKIEEYVVIYQHLSPEEKKSINLYYLSIAHTINSYKYRKVSNFISVTTDYQVANTFAGNTIIYGWIPRKSLKNEYKLIEYVIVKNGALAKHHNLPYCDSPVYPEQKEVALRCGLLPHFIIGFSIDHNFYVNPAIFQSIDKMRELDSYAQLSEYKKRIVLQGLEIDQTGFEEYCRRTNYKRYIIFDGDKYWLNPLCKDNF